MAPRIVIIGGASLQWVPKLFLDIVNTPSLVESEIVLQDIDPAPLPDVSDFIRHVSGLAGVGITVATAPDVIFNYLGGSTAGTTYAITHTPSSKSVKVVVALSGRVCITPTAITTCS